MAGLISFCANFRRQEIARNKADFGESNIMENQDLSMLNDRAFALHLLDLQSMESAIYKTAEAMFKGKDIDPMQVQKAISELHIMRKTALAIELRSRHPMEYKYKEMTEAEMASWVRQNCKFASVKTAGGIMDFMGPLQPGMNPHQIFQNLLQAYKKRAAAFGPTTPEEVSKDLLQIDNQMFGGKQTLNTPENTQALLQSATPAAPAAAPSRYIPDPVDQYMNQPHLPKPRANGI